MGYDACAYTCSSLGEFPAAREYLEKSLALYDPAHRPFYTELMPSDMLVVLLQHSTIPSACLGHLDLASSRADMALTEARRLAHPHTLVDALAWAWMTGWCIGSEPELLSQWADELLAVSVEHELALYRVASFWARGWCLAASGHSEDGIQLLARGVTGLHDAGFMLHRPFWLTLLADACRMGGDWQDALGHLAGARRFAEETGDRWALAEVLRRRGDVLLALGDSAAAEASYCEAIAIAQQQSAKLVGIARRDEPRPAVARPRQARAGARASGAGLRLVHRGLRHAGSARGQGAGGGAGSMSAVRNWLEAIGLGQYADAFEANDIDTDLLAQIDDQLLKDIGVLSAGHRLRLRNAIAKLAPTSTAGANATNAIAATDASSTFAERRQLTVMFCDLVGSTALSARLDPEDLRAVIGAYHRCVAKVIGRGGGFVAKYMGDGVLAYFGYPRADEHDAERAVRAALKLVEKVAGVDTVAAAPLQVRVGIATGLVVVGDLIGQGASQEQAVVGETPNLAARLQALAEPGTVVIAPSTRRLTGGLFEYADLGAVELKGLGAPVMAARVLRGSAAESRFEALHGRDLTPLVGRDEELALLQRRWQQAKAGEGRVVVLIGEPGIGKSRLAQAMLEQPAGEPHTRLRYFCSPHHQASALHPFITQLEHAAGFSREDMPEARLAKLEALLARSNAGAEEIGFIAERMSIPTGDKYRLPDLTPQRRKEKTLEALLAQLARLAAQQPVLMLFEDAHWIDPTSLELLTLTVARASTLPLLLLVTARPEFTPPWPADAHVTMQALARLGRREGMTLVERSAGGKALPAEILEQILARTDGVPLFLEELTKTIIESGLLREEDGHYALDGALPPLAIPTTLHDSLMARLDRLAPVREVAQIGAAIGREFSYPLLSAVAQQPDDRLTEALDRLVRAELVFGRGEVPEAVYTFKHALVQEAAYASLLRERRRSSTPGSPGRSKASSRKWPRPSRNWSPTTTPPPGSPLPPSIIIAAPRSGRWRPRPTPRRSPI